MISTTLDRSERDCECGYVERGGCSHYFSMEINMNILTAKGGGERQLHCLRPPVVLKGVDTVIFLDLTSGHSHYIHVILLHSYTDNLMITFYQSITPHSDTSVTNTLENIDMTIDYITRHTVSLWPHNQPSYTVCVPLPYNMTLRLGGKNFPPLPFVTIDE